MSSERTSSGNSPASTNSPVPTAKTPRASTPTRQIPDRSDGSDFRGCAFINVMAETADPESAVYRMAAEHKRAVVEFLSARLSNAGYRDHGRLAEQFLLLIDGATVTALHERTNQPMQRAKAVAGMLLEQAGRDDGHPRSGT